MMAMIITDVLNVIIDYESSSVHHTVIITGVECFKMA